MYIIKSQDKDTVNKIVFTDKNYISDGEYKPEVVFYVSYNNLGFLVHFDVFEKNPRATYKENFSPVYEDSCVEWFVNFDPEYTSKYFNIEINASGCVDMSFRRDRYEKIDLTQSEVESLNISTQIYENHWTVDYIVKFELIQKYFINYKFEKGQKFSSNVYKCADALEVFHEASWKPINLNKRDFHCPELFGTMTVE